MTRSPFRTEDRTDYWKAVKDGKTAGVIAAPAGQKRRWAALRRQLSASGLTFERISEAEFLLLGAIAEHRLELYT